MNKIEKIDDKEALRRSVLNKEALDIQEKLKELLEKDDKKM